MFETYSTGKEENLGLSETNNSQNTIPSDKDSNILIAYFTYGENAGFTGNVDASSSASIQLFNGRVTGNTGVMAQMISDVSGGDLFSIRTVEPYPENYNDTVNIGKEEKNKRIKKGKHLTFHILSVKSYLLFLELLLVQVHEPFEVRSDGFRLHCNLLEAVYHQ